MSERICSECIHAALDSAGVYCKLFHEQILNERVAEECGEFESDTWPPPAAETEPLRLVVAHSNGQESPERERTVCVQVDMDYYGRKEIGEKIVKNLERELALSYGERVRLKRL